MKISQETRTRARIKKLEEGIQEHKIDSLFCKIETFCFNICENILEASSIFQNDVGKCNKQIPTALQLQLVHTPNYFMIT